MIPKRTKALSPPPRARGAFRHPMNPLLELIKARLSSLVLATTAVGFVMGSHGSIVLPTFLWTLAGTGLAAAGANALNEWVEWQRDARMERTQGRPLPSGTMSLLLALLLGVSFAAGGVLLLAWKANLLTAALGAFVVLLYVLVYTPLKHRTPLCTLFGAVCGAIPPVMGYTGASGAVDLGACVLALTLFLWQIPHFLSLAWLYREDYQRGGFRMLPSVDPTGKLTGVLVIVYILALLPIGFLSLLIGMTGWVFFGGSLLLGTGLFLLGMGLHRQRSDRSARRLFLGSIIYLPLLLALFVADRGPARGFESRYYRQFGPLELRSADSVKLSSLSPARTDAEGSGPFMALYPAGPGVRPCNRRGRSHYSDGSLVTK